MERSIEPSALGHVIRIIDRYTVIVDVGKSRLSVGNIIQIYSLGEPIIGLDGKELCKYVFVKDTLDVIDVQDEYSVCQKNKEVTRKINFNIPLSPLLEQTFSEREALSVNDDEIQRMPHIENKVHIGDFIKFA